MENLAPYVAYSPQNVATKMKLGNVANEVDATNIHDYTRPHFFQNNGCGVYLVSLKKKHALARAKQEITSLKAILANQKDNISANR